MSETHPVNSVICPSCGALEGQNCFTDDGQGTHGKRIQGFLEKYMLDGRKLAEDHEREECARLVERYVKNYPVNAPVLRSVVLSIRARGEKKR